MRPLQIAGIPPGKAIQVSIERVARRIESMRPFPVLKYRVFHGIADRVVRKFESTDKSRNKNGQDDRSQRVEGSPVTIQHGLVQRTQFCRCNPTMFTRLRSGHVCSSAPSTWYATPCPATERRVL